MRKAADWSRNMASSRGTYSVALSMGFLFLNVLVHFTYEWSGRISFSYLSLRLVFADALTNLTGQPGFVGVLLFGVLTIALLRGILAMFGTKMQIIGWLLLLALFVAALPIFDYRRIHM